MSPSPPDGGRRARTHRADGRAAARRRHPAARAETPLQFPTPIDERRRRAFLTPVAVLAVAAAGVLGGVVWLTGRDDGAAHGPGALAAQDASSGAAAPTGATGLASTVSLASDPVAVFDGVVGADSPTEIAVTGLEAGLDERGLALLSVTVTADESDLEFAVRPCGGATTAAGWSVPAGSIDHRHVAVPVGGDGTVCASSSATASASVELDGFADAGTVQPLAAPVRIVDSTPGGRSADDRFAGIGVRPVRSTLRVPVTARFSGLEQVGALLVSVAAVDPLEDGEMAVFAPEAAVPNAPSLAYEAERTGRTTALLPVGASGELCVSTTGRTDLVVDLLGLVRTSEVAAIEADAGATIECPGQTMFPDRRIVALYGTQRSEKLGVLGEQPPEEAAARLAEIAEPWRAGDRPVLPAFELIATLATGTPEDRGVYNLRSSPEFVQEYLDVARRHGYYLILDLQPGQSDFLTEAKYYEDFLRQPDVGLALDPEWRTAPPARPKGGRIGTVDAAEVNEVIEYVAQLVAEEHLPEKLVVLHQFEPNMITNRDQIVELPGVAINLHMDGFGPRPEKLNSYDVVRAGPPWNMGLKLFFDEDTDLLEASDVLDGGLFEPIPDMITYQ